MTVLALILYILLVVLLKASAFLLVSPILIGFITIILVDIVSLIKRSKPASVLWHVLTVIITAVMTGVLWNDIFDEMADVFSLPFVVLGIYGLISLIVYSIPEKLRQETEHRQVVPGKKFSEQSKGCYLTSLSIAIVCTVMAGIGALIVLTKSAAVSDSLPPAVLFAVAAIICWIIAARKRCAAVQGDPADGQKSPGS